MTDPLRSTLNGSVPTPNVDGTDESYWEDEGWIWLPHEEVMAIQRQKNAIMRQMLDSVALNSSPRVVLLRDNTNQKEE
jgi:hypothetical protein